MEFEAARNVAARYRREWEWEYAKLSDALREALGNRTMLPADYWKAELRARRRYWAAIELVELLEDA